MKVLLDTNVWTYIGERRERESFEALEDQLGLTVVIPPSILLEALQTPIASVRTLVIDALTSRGSTRVHLLPEARLEADEVVLEAQRCRREWCVRFPPPNRVRRLEAFWTRRIWQQAAVDPELVAKAIPARMREIAAGALAVQRSNKKIFLEDNFHLEDSPPWTDLSNQPESVKVGWDGERMECWRVEGAITW